MTIRNVTEPLRDSLMAATYFLRFGLGALPALLGLADRFLDGLGRRYKPCTVQVHFMDFPGSVDVHLASYAVPGLAKTL